MYNTYKAKKIIVGRLPFGKDIMESLKDVCRKEKISFANIHLIGAVKNATVGFYNQGMKEYTSLKFNEPLEILSSFGNVSIKDGNTFIHLHITLSGSEGKAIGGHLLSPTEVFACEFSIIEMEGKELVRQHDEITGLYLWDL